MGCPRRHAAVLLDCVTLQGPFAVSDIHIRARCWKYVSKHKLNSCCLIHALFSMRRRAQTASPKTTIFKRTSDQFSEKPVPHSEPQMQRTLQVNMYRGEIKKKKRLNGFLKYFLYSTARLFKAYFELQLVSEMKRKNSAPFILF